MRWRAVSRVAWCGPLGVLLATLVGCGSSSPGPGGLGGYTGGGTGGGNMWAAGERGLMAATTDGVHVAARSSGTVADLHALVCIGDRVAWAAGADGTIVATTDGGAAWVRQVTPVSATLRGVAFFDGQRGVAVGDGATILRTTDGGATWTQTTAPTSAALRAVTITSSSGATLYAVGEDAIMLRSTDSGATFEEVILPSAIAGATFRSVKFTAGGTRGVVVGNGGVILSSSDGGYRWLVEPSGTSNDLHGVGVTGDGQYMLAVGAGGLVMRAAVVAARSWTTIASGTTASLNAVGFSGDALAGATGASSGWIVGDTGTILRTTDGGLTFSALESPSQGNFATIEDF